MYAASCFSVTANAQNLHLTRQTFVWFRYRFWTKYDLVAAAAQPPRAVGELAEAEQVVGLEQRETVLEVEALAGLDLVADRLQGVDRNRHQRVLSTAA